MSTQSATNKLWFDFQMDNSAYNSSSLVPEAELMRAVLALAIDDLKTRGLRYKRARAFFMSKESDHVFSFAAICHFFSIDPCKARKRILGDNSIKFEKRRNKFKSELDTE